MKHYLRSWHFEQRHKAFGLPFIGAALSLLLLAPAAHAVLPPNVEQARELASVTEAVGKRFPGQPIKSITRQTFDSYDVLVGTCRLKAEIVTLPTPRGMVGPRQYTVRLSRPKCTGTKQ